MQRTIAVKLSPTTDQASALEATAAAYRACFNTVAARGWMEREKNGVALHRATYYPLRAAHPDLPAQLVVSARMKATEALRSAFTRQRQGRKVGCPRTERSSVRYDARSYRMDVSGGIAGLSTTAGRLKLPFHVHPRARYYLDRATGFDSAELIRRSSGWWLNVVLTVPDRPFVPNGRVVGVDLGINRPAVTSGAKFLGERRWKGIEQRYFRLRRGLQSKGTKSARRHLKKLAGRLGRFRRDCDHVLSRRIVQGVSEGTVIVVENLTDIRARTKQRGRRQRRRHHGWSFAQLRGFLTYKAEEAGCRVEAVDPRGSSQRCHRCGHVHRRNRPTQAAFHCQACGYRANADWNAARNLVWKYRALSGMSGAGGPNVNRPIVGGSCPHGLAHKPSASAGSR